MEDIDGRAESSFNPQDVVFPDYDANQLQSILERRRDAYQDDVLEDGIIPLSAAFAAQDHGDARKAIDLFRKAGGSLIEPVKTRFVKSTFATPRKKLNGTGR